MLVTNKKKKNKENTLNCVYNCVIRIIKERNEFLSLFSKPGLLVHAKNHRFSSDCIFQIKLKSSNSVLYKTIIYYIIYVYTVNDLKLDRIQVN